MHQDLPVTTSRQILCLMFSQLGIGVTNLKCGQIACWNDRPELEQELEETEKMFVSEVVESYLNNRSRFVSSDENDSLSSFQNDLDILYQKRYTHLLFRHVQLLRNILAVFENKF